MTLGVFVHAADCASEGFTSVFDTLQQAGVTAVAVAPQVARPVADGEGTRFPDLHVDGHERVLTRPLFERRELWLESYPAPPFEQALFAGGPYRPRADAPPAELDGSRPRAMIAEAQRRGMQAHLQLSPFVPSGVLPEDQPLRIDGSRAAPPVVALNACLNSPAAQHFAFALLRERLGQYREVDGLFLDWAEYGAYTLEDLFTCFCPHCERVARATGLDWDAMRGDAQALWSWLHALSPTALRHARRVFASPSQLLGLLVQRPGWLALLRLKAHTVTHFYTTVRQLLDDLGLPGVRLNARGWPPPWNRASGMDYAALAGVCDAVTPKLFTFDYAAVPRWYGQTLVRWNPGLDESDVLDALVELLDLPDSIAHRTFDHYRIPAPDEPHLADLACYRRRIDEVCDQVAGRAKVLPFAHAYLPLDQWKRMVAVIRDSRADGMWIQMYGYLSDDHLRVLRDVWPAT